MRTFASILGIVGAFSGAALGLKWQSDLNDPAVQMGRSMMSGFGAFGDPEAARMAQQLSQMETASSILLLSAALGGVASIMLLAKVGPPKVMAVLLIIAGFFPMLFSANAVFGLPMTLGGLLALFVKNEESAPLTIKTGATARAEYLDPLDYR